MTVSMNSWGSCQVLINACYAIMSMFNSVNQCILRAEVSSYKVMTLALSVNKCLRRSDCHSKLVRGKSQTITINRIHIARSIAINIMSESIDAINSTWPMATINLALGPIMSSSSLHIASLRIIMSQTGTDGVWQILDY